jgi:hypothetical protein
MLKNRLILETVATSVKAFIQQKFQYLLKNRPFIYALNGILRDDENELRVLYLFEAISALDI